MKIHQKLFSGLLAGLLVGCGGGGGGDSSDDGQDPLQPPLYNATGRWSITETQKTSNCPATPPTETFSLNVTHPTGSNSLSVTALDTGRTYQGTISGSTVTFAGPGSNSDCPAGFALSVRLDLASDSRLSGSSSWTCQYGSGSCSGTTRFDGIKTGGGLDVTAPSTPTLLQANGMSTSQIGLQWSAASDDVEVARYRIERCQGAGCSEFAQIASTDATASQYIDATGVPATTYRYRVGASDAAGNMGAMSNILQATTLSAAPPDTPPSVPTGLAAVALSSSSIRLTWVASKDDIGVAGYRVYQDDDNPVTPLVLLSTVTTPTLTLPGLQASSRYCFRVEAFDTGNFKSDTSSPACATTPASPAPTTVTLTSAKDAVVLWSDTTPVASQNFGGSGDLGVGNYHLEGAAIDSNLRARALVDFAFDPEVWRGKSIVSAVLRLHVASYAVQRDAQYRVFKIDDALVGGVLHSPWDETKVTWNSMPAYASTPSALANAPSNPAAYTDWDVTAIVREWLATDGLGNGLMIMDITPNEPSRTDNQITTYASRESPTRSLRPQLIVTY